ncbi:hypothetical protein [Phyllobacterium sp. K27]
MAKHGTLAVMAFLMSFGQITTVFANDVKNCIAEMENEKGWLFVNNCHRDVVIEICFEVTTDTAVNCSSIIQHQDDRLYPATVIAANSGLQLLDAGTRAGIRWGACYHFEEDNRNPGKPEGEWKFTYRCKNSNVESGGSSTDSSQQ